MAELEKIKRRDFIQKTIYLVGFGALANSPLKLIAKEKPRESLLVLHTNDWHSRIEPFPEIDKQNAGMGGAAHRAALIKNLREKEGEVLLLDSGDIFQGTPYFNFYGGELEYKLMSAMGYDCVTLGNHDLDNGIEGITSQLAHAQFKFVNANYDFKNTALANVVKPYTIFKKKGLKIGVFGLGIELQGLVPEKLYGNIVYNDPAAAANKTAEHLKFVEKCDVIICLSHLGYKYNNNKVSDLVLAEKTQYIDLILGGHTHTFLNEPVVAKNLINKNVVVNQVGWAGLRLGAIRISFEPFVNTIRAVYMNGEHSINIEKI
jgi:5'-nucleotidase